MIASSEVVALGSLAELRTRFGRLSAWRVDIARNWQREQDKIVLENRRVLRKWGMQMPWTRAWRLLHKRGPALTKPLAPLVFLHEMAMVLELTMPIQPFHDCGSLPEEVRTTLKALRQRWGVEGFPQLLQGAWDELGAYGCHSFTLPTKLPFVNVEFHLAGSRTERCLEKLKVYLVSVDQVE